MTRDCIYALTHDLICYGDGTLTEQEVRTRLSGQLLKTVEVVAEESGRL